MTTPVAAQGGVMMIFLGIDWSEQKHDLCFLNDAGAAIARQTISHTPEGFLELDATRQQLNISAADCWVGLETAHSLLIDFLWAHGYSQVYVIPPSVTKSSRGRYCQTGAHTDQSDAFVLADLLRTDCGRLHPWHPDSLLTRQIRSSVHLVTQLRRETVRFSNRLRAVLLRYYPVAPQLFSGLDTKIALRFVQEYPTPQVATHLTLEQFRTFTQAQGYTHPQNVMRSYAKLQQSQPQADPDTVVICQAEAVQLAILLEHLVQAEINQSRALLTHYHQHPDYPIFDSLPGLGDYLGPALLVHFGDDRQRFPTSASVQALAGTCPVTEASGKRRWVHFRRACNYDFRNLTQQWARTSLPQSVWAQAYWTQIRPRCASNSHAYRCLANRWLAVAWKLWQTRQPYDEGYHLQQRAARSKPHA
jgi:transposase